jgi:DNA repair protein RecO (recombination protein O)
VKQNDKAIFLHRINYSESSLIVTFYTLESGIQKFIFQGGKKKSQSLFPLSLCDIHYYRRPDSELGKLTDAFPYEMLHTISTNPMKSTLAYFMVDVLKQCLQTDQSDPALFSFVEQRVISLNKETDLTLFGVQFLIEFAKHMGIEPSVEEENKRFFHLQDGEFSDFSRKGELVAEGADVGLIQSLLRKEKATSISKNVRHDALITMIEYYKLHTPRFEVEKSLEIIHEILYT